MVFQYMLHRQDQQHQHLYRGPDSKILFLSTQRPPTAHKISSPPDLPFWRYKGSKFQLSHLFPQNWVITSPPYFAKSIIGMTPKNPYSFVKVSRTVSEIFGILLSDPIVYLQKILLEWSH